MNVSWPTGPCRSDVSSRFTTVWTWAAPKPALLYVRSSAKGTRFRKTKPLVVQAGAIMREKGVPDFLHAARRVLHDGAAVHFLVAGEGPQQQELPRLSEQLGISAQVTFTGRVRDPLGSGLWAACDIACQVSLWQEAFGLTIAEAMAAGKPVIGTRIGAIPELIEDGRSGFLVEPGDTADLAEKISLLARDPRQREDLGRTGKRICQEKFSLEKNVASLIGWYGIS